MQQAANMRENGRRPGCPGPSTFRQASPLAEKPRVLIIDNFDSFTFNLAQLLGRLGAEPLVRRNDEIPLAQIRDFAPQALVISPGPGNPASKEDFGISGEAIMECSGKIPVLGVCLGHQGIVHFFGGKVVRAKNLMHGKTSEIGYRREGILSGLEGELVVMRYHSLVAERESLPPCLEVLATSKDDGEIMAIRHREHQTFGLQFHPESAFTPKGELIMRAFLGLVKSGDAARTGGG
jgi:anthranilate synthase component 2